MRRLDTAGDARLYLQLVELSRRRVDGQQAEVPRRQPQRVPVVQHGADAEDVNLSLMIWHGTEPLVQENEQEAISLLGKAKIPRVREYLARRIAVPGKLVPLLTREKDATIQGDVLRGLQAALEGWREVPMPCGWMAAYDELARSPASEVRERAVALSVLFGDRKALASLHKTLVDQQAPLAARRHALQTLLDKKDPELLGLLPGLLADQGMRGPAVRGLAAYQNEGTPQAIWRHYASWKSLDLVGFCASLLFVFVSSWEAQTAWKRSYHRAQAFFVGGGTANGKQTGPEANRRHVGDRV